MGHHAQSSAAVAGYYLSNVVAGNKRKLAEVCRQLAAADGRTIPPEPGFTFEDVEESAGRPRRLSARDRLLAGARAASLRFQHLYLSHLRALSADPAERVLIVRELEDADLLLRTGDGYVSGHGFLTACDPDLASLMPMIVGPGRMFSDGVYWADRVGGLLNPALDPHDYSTSAAAVAARLLRSRT